MSNWNPHPDDRDAAMRASKRIEPLVEPRFRGGSVYNPIVEEMDRLRKKRDPGTSTSRMTKEEAIELLKRLGMSLHGNCADELFAAIGVTR